MWRDLPRCPQQRRGRRRRQGQGRWSLSLRRQRSPRSRWPPLRVTASPGPQSHLPHLPHHGCRWRPPVAKLMRRRCPLTPWSDSPLLPRSWRAWPARLGLKPQADLQVRLDLSHLGPWHSHKQREELPHQHQLQLQHDRHQHQQHQPSPEGRWWWPIQWSAHVDEWVARQYHTNCILVGPPAQEQGTHKARALTSARGWVSRMKRLRSVQYKH